MSPTFHVPRDTLIIPFPTRKEVFSLRYTYRSSPCHNQVCVNGEISSVQIRTRVIDRNRYNGNDGEIAR